MAGLLNDRDRSRGVSFSVLTRTLDIGTASGRHQKHEGKSLIVANYTYRSRDKKISSVHNTTSNSQPYIDTSPKKWHPKRVSRRSPKL